MQTTHRACITSRFSVLFTPIFQAIGSAGDDISTQVENPVAALDLPDSTIETSERHLVSPSLDEDAYIIHSASLGVASTSVTIAENGLVYGVTALEALANTRHDGAVMDGKLKTGFIYGFDTTDSTVSEPPTPLFLLNTKT